MVSPNEVIPRRAKSKRRAISADRAARHNLTRCRALGATPGGCQAHSCCTLARRPLTRWVVGRGRAGGGLARYSAHSVDSVTLHWYNADVNDTRGLSLPELTAQAEVSPRTIRYYIAEGLLPSPGSGPGARYGEGHLARIRLIKQLQRGHLPLAEIRNRLSQLTDEQVHDLVREPRVAEPPTSALEYVRAALSETAPDGAAAAGPVPSLPLAVRGHGRPGLAYRPTADRSHWERVSLDPDIELHIRRPLTRQHNRAVGRIIGAAREILEEETR